MAGHAWGIEWSLRALASMRAVRLLLRARAAIKFALRAASTLENTDGEQRALRNFCRRNLDLSFIEKKRFVPSNLADTIQPIPAAYSQLCLVGCQFTSDSSCELQCSTLGGRSRRSKAFYYEIVNTSREEA